MHEHRLELPTPIRDARTLRTLALLDLESHPPAASIDRVAIAVDVAEGRVLQFGLFARTLPSDTGVGLAESAIYDERGRVGRSVQSLLIDDTR